MDDDARRVVLARRARFVALALAGLTPTCHSTTPAESEPASPGEIIIEVPEAKSNGDDGDASAPGRSGDAGAAAPVSSIPIPQVCLSY